MKIRIGRGLDGAPVSFETTGAALLVLVGDRDRGKTTLARYLARWWVADARRTARVFAEEPHQYGDLPLEVATIADAEAAVAAVDAHELTILDGADKLTAATLHRHAVVPRLTIVTSYGEAARLLDGGAHLCLGLLPRENPGGHRWPAAAGRQDDAAQGRLDWPSAVVALVPDPRGERDLPIHRWQTPTPWCGRAAG